MKILLRELKKGFTYNRNGYTVYYQGGRIIFSTFGYSNRFSTLKEMRETVKEDIDLIID